MSYSNPAGLGFWISKLGSKNEVRNPLILFKDKKRSLILYVLGDVVSVNFELLEFFGVIELRNFDLASGEIHYLLADRVIVSGIGRDPERLEEPVSGPSQIYALPATYRFAYHICED